MPIFFGMRYFTPIVTTQLEMMGSILLANMSSSDQMCTLEELSTITDDPLESNKTFSNYSTPEEII